MKTQIDAWGFVDRLSECSLHWGEDMKSLTIKPPPGGRIGLPFGDAIRELTNKEAREANIRAMQKCAQEDREREAKRKVGA